MTDDDIVRAIEENVAAFLLAMGRAGGGEERDEGAKVRWTVGGSPIAYHNAVVRAQLEPEEADAAIDEFVQRLRRRGVPGSWHIGPSTRPLDLCARLSQRGFSDCETGAEPGMAADLTVLPSLVYPDRFRLDHVMDTDRLEKFRLVLAAGFGEGELEANWVCQTFARIGLGDPAWRHYLGTLDGSPVSTVSLFFSSGAAGIYFICTAPDERRRGIGAATTRAAMAAAQEHGYERAVLTSSAMGFGVYQRLGFRQYCVIRVPEYDPNRAGR